MRGPEEIEVDGESRECGHPSRAPPSVPVGEPRTPVATGEDVAEIVFFKYGVAVFFGFDEMQKRNILEFVHGAGILKGARVESEWKVRNVILHMVQRLPIRAFTTTFSSTLLAHYESRAHTIIHHPRTQALPCTLARTGAIALSRRDAMRITGKRFTLRRDVVLGRDILDVPSIFW
ncbi:hypothetical protein F5148DRAFT_1149170 [Russula earlei]|uniref:Uncharacterized protein n=1 Tax=Russula earlei TaxID=71964 RepID=A0ACC0U9G4_9AGAM|nr:hypothetical protein F5148DRAFT_1149170 [Russula earlei]